MNSEENSNNFEQAIQSIMMWTEVSSEQTQQVNLLKTQLSQLSEQNKNLRLKNEEVLSKLVGDRSPSDPTDPTSD